jgi:hypothetical protein
MARPQSTGHRKRPLVTVMWTAPSASSESRSSWSRVPSMRAPGSYPTEVNVPEPAVTVADRSSLGSSAAGYIIQIDSASGSLTGSIAG